MRLDVAYSLSTQPLMRVPRRYYLLFARGPHPLFCSAALPTRTCEPSEWDMARGNPNATGRSRHQQPLPPSPSPSPSLRLRLHHAYAARVYGTYTARIWHVCNSLSSIRWLFVALACNVHRSFAGVFTQVSCAFYASFTRVLHRTAILLLVCTGVLASSGGVSNAAPGRCPRAAVCY